ncbi:MAG: hypothetical protein WC906_01090 [Parcubacteria group bacterium]|jgi:hypothetical protein
MANKDYFEILFEDIDCGFFNLPSCHWIHFGPEGVRSVDIYIQPFQEVIFLKLHFQDFPVGFYSPESIMQTIGDYYEFEAPANLRQVWESTIRIGKKILPEKLGKLKKEWGELLPQYLRQYEEESMIWKRSMGEVPLVADVGMMSLIFHLFHEGSEIAKLYLCPHKRLFILETFERDELPYQAKTVEGISRIIKDRFGWSTPPGLQEAWDAIENYPISFPGIGDIEMANSKLRQKWQELIAS